MQRTLKMKALAAAVSLALMGGVGMTQAAVNVQCPQDDDGDAIQDATNPDPGPNGGTVKCLHFAAGDGFAEMSDGHPMYTFGFSNITGTAPEDAIYTGILNARWPGPTIALDQGDELYLSLTNVGTVMRPDLFDPHTVHYHGFPNAATVFDGVPEVSISINMGSTLTYYYNNVEPGTYIYHCHVEATEHMEMGMLANLYVHAGQDRTGIGGTVASPDVATQAARFGGAGPEGYAYNDEDGTTAYDVEAPIQVSGMDGNFHDQHILVQPLPFAELKTDYPMINGRGYPDTVLDDVNRAPGDPLVMQPPEDTDGFLGEGPGTPLNNGVVSQDMGSAIRVSAGERLLLRLSNVSIDRFFTVTAPGLKMKIVGTGARQMRGPDGKNIYVDTTSVNFGGGETHDVIIDTTGVAPGTYFLTSAEFYMMSNATQLDGGLVTEIVVN